MTQHPERWAPAPVPEFATTYEVSDLGRVRRTSTGRVLKLAIKPKGYRVVSMQTPALKRTHSVHRLVARAFVPGWRPGLEVRHLHGVASGDAAAGLAWGTAKDNARDRDERGNNHNASKTHCLNEHEFTPDNTRRDADGHRICRRCERARGLIYDRRRRGRKKAS